MIKLIASDLDGTLLHDYQQTVPEDIYDTIRALHDKESSSQLPADVSMPISADCFPLWASIFPISQKWFPLHL